MDGLGFPFDESYVRNQSFFFEDELPEVLVWVESPDDKRLWLPVFNALQGKKFHFKFLTASAFVGVDGKRADGCNRIIKLCKSGDIEVGHQQIVCLDSDHRFLASFSERYDGDQLDDGHFYWTIVHSKENIEISADALDAVLQHVLFCPKHELIQTAQEVLVEFSNTVSQCVYLLGFLEGKHWAQNTQELSDFKDSFLSAFAPLYRCASQHSIDFSTDEKWLEFRELCTDLNRALIDYVQATNWSHEYELYLNQVLAAGVTPEKCYLFVRGHDLHAVTCAVFRSVCAAYKADMISDIKLGSPDTLRQRMAEFKKRWIGFDDCLQAKVPDVSNTPFFDKTIQRLRLSYL